MAITTPTSATAWRPDVIAAWQFGVMIPDALVAQTSTVVGTVQGDQPYVRVPYISADPPASFYPEGSTIVGGDPTMSEVAFQTGKLAALSRLSNESLRQPLDVASALFTSFQRSLRRQANRVYLSNPVTAGQPTGLVNTPGIHVGGALGANLDGVADAIAFIESNDGSADYVIMDPLSWGSLRKMKATSSGGTPLLGPPSADGTRALFGVPVVVSSQMPFTAPVGTTAGSGSVLVVDKLAVVSAFSDVELARSTDVYFASDSTGLRATCRIGFGVLFPNRIAKLSVTLPA